MLNKNFAEACLVETIITDLCDQASEHKAYIIAAMLG